MNEEAKTLFLSTQEAQVKTEPALNQFQPYPKITSGNLYRGHRHEIAPTVYCNGWTLENRFDEVSDYPKQGFDWGHCGQRCAELAYSILANEFGVVYAGRQYQNFKRDVVAYLPENDWTLTSEQITFLTAKNSHTKDSNAN
jgi:hypothetical protein